MKQTTNFPATSGQSVNPAPEAATSANNAAHDATYSAFFKYVFSKGLLFF